MNKICTNIEQSKKLIELGIDTNTADMYWWSTSLRYYIEAMDDGDFNEAEGHVPAWSLSALLGLMPRSICIRETEFSGYFYFLEWQFANDNSLRYVGHDGKCLIDIYSDHDVKLKDSIDTAFEMIVWLKENNKL